MYFPVQVQLQKTKPHKDRTPQGSVRFSEKVTWSSFQILHYFFVLFAQTAWILWYLKNAPILGGVWVLGLRISIGNRKRIVIATINRNLSPVWWALSHKKEQKQWYNTKTPQSLGGLRSPKWQKHRYNFQKKQVNKSGEVTTAFSAKRSDPRRHRKRPDPRGV